ncbi:MAG: ATP synthase F1 subunit delta [Pseudoflavonifractor sp.]|nr:ATP synthase F1 subunit delta [Pseudoflavonifractor sp.]
MNEGLIPRRYAKAIYEFALEKGDSDRMYELMQRLAASFASEPSLQTAMSNPFVPVADKHALLVTASGATKSDTVFADTLRLLDTNKRLDFARDIAMAYLDIYRKANHIYRVDITSAAPLPEAEMKRLHELVTRHLKGGRPEFSDKVDPVLIGGFIIDIGSERLDASVSNELKQLRLKLLSKS